MKILIAPDKFKGSLSSEDVCNAVESGLRRKSQDYLITKVPVADGGEGTCDILTMHSQGSKVRLSSVDPLGRKIETYYGISGDGTCAFIEMAAASGLHLLKRSEYDPAHTSTVGTGLMIRHAMDKGVQRIVLGIGGSATNDAGVGMASVLGFVFRNSTRIIEHPNGSDLITLREIRQVDPVLTNVSVTVLCDVTNPLYGPNGAANIFAPQKGANSHAVAFLDAGLTHFAQLVNSQFGIDLNFPGAGAGGGMGAGARFFLNAEIDSGIDYVMKFVDLETKVREADVVITGEGKLDQQSLSGKVIAGISRLCSQHHKPLFIVTGKSELSLDEAQTLGCAAIISLIGEGISQEEAMTSARQLLERRVYEQFPLWKE